MALPTDPPGSAGEKPAPFGGAGGQPSPAGMLASVPARWRPRAALILGHWVGRLLLRVADETVRVQIFDRAMTLAAQVFTSVFPLLIMLSALFGGALTSRLAGAVHLPAGGQQVLNDALGSRSDTSFGVLGSIIVLASATGLARAMTRSYATIWQVRPRPAGPMVAARWLLTVILLAIFVIGVPLLNGLTSALPTPHLAKSVILLLADCAVTILLPRLLLARALPLWKFVAGGLVFGLAMLAVRPVGAVYLPRALKASDERYGAIGIAFTYIGWLYVVSFCLLLAAVIGRVVTEAFLPEDRSRDDDLELSGLAARLSRPPAPYLRRLLAAARARLRRGRQHTGDGDRDRPREGHDAAHDQPRA
jgi:membrane protein